MTKWTKRFAGTHSVH